MLVVNIDDRLSFSEADCTECQKSSALSGWAAERSTEQPVFLESLKSAGLRVKEIDSGLQAETGSDILFRVLGIPLGSRQLPVGIDVQVTRTGNDARVAATAYDRLGWYINKKLLWGEGVVDRKLTGLLNAVRSATGQSALPEGKATFNP